MTNRSFATRSRTSSRSRESVCFASTRRTQSSTSGTAAAECRRTTHIATSPSSARLLRRRNAVSTYNQSLTMIQFHSLESPQLERFLERSRSGFSLRGEGVELDLVLRQILQKAYEFVPSESGSILLDDPFRKVPNRGENELVFIATFGDSSRNLIGKRLGAQHGI